MLNKENSQKHGVVPSDNEMVQTWAEIEERAALSQMHKHTSNQKTNQMLLQELMNDDFESKDIMEFSAQNVQDDEDEPLAFSSGGAIAAALEQQDPGISKAI